MPKALDITGRVFGKLTVIKRVNNSRPFYWLCKCECGTVREVNQRYLVKGDTTSCGCYQLEVSLKKLEKYIVPRTHCKKGHPLETRSGGKYCKPCQNHLRGLRRVRKQIQEDEQLIIQLKQRLIELQEILNET